MNPQSPTATESDEPGIIIPHGSKKHPDAVILVSPEDVARVSQYNWTPFRPGRGVRIRLYAQTSEPGNNSHKFYLHRYILELTDPKVQVDHINHDALDCRRSNMRIVSAQRNAFNRRPDSNSSSRFKGVCWAKASGKWAAYISRDGRQKHLGFFTDEVEAGRAYDAAARELFGEYACLNFPDIDGKVAA